MTHLHHQELVEFSHQHHLEGLSEPSLEAILEHRIGYTVEKGHAFLHFQERIDRELLQHKIITSNAYTAWFSKGEQTQKQVRDFIVQFSVFSNQFLVAQLQKTINADTIDGMRASKEILANEIGVIFNGTKPVAGKDMDREGDPELVSTEGTVEGGVFRFQAAHFEWLNRIAGKLGLDFSDIGRRVHATASTLFYCDELIRLYGSPDYAISQAASYAVENWAAAGFWDELVEGLDRYNHRTGEYLPLSFFSWHSRLEAQHAQHTQEELEELYCTRKIDEDMFIRIGNKMLDGVAAFWNGLEQQRKSIV